MPGKVASALCLFYVIHFIDIPKLLLVIFVSEVLVQAVGRLEVYVLRALMNTQDVGIVLPRTAAGVFVQTFQRRELDLRFPFALPSAIWLSAFV